ncbi:zf-HC2 domain-containing protein [Solwaraspora sp. WMMB335]|uniref:zf-HC2 domain-containing protein n=1 Tax=Solwaraspora sp. WMMB335 TaxID=3404118 RepID=UPI003B943C49
MIGGPCDDPATRSLLGTYVLGRLDHAEAESTRRHLTSCPSCRESEASLRTVAIALKLLRPTDVADLVDQFGPARGIPDGPPSASRVTLTRCRFDLVLGPRNQRRRRPLPSARRS